VRADRPFWSLYQRQLGGQWRTDYVGNMSFATGGGSYSFMTGGDYPNGVNRFSILNSGNVGVGTNNPQSLYMLPVESEQTMTS
jgi:hypothetical protein